MGAACKSKAQPVESNIDSGAPIQSQVDDETQKLLSKVNPEDSSQKEILKVLTKAEKTSRTVEVKTQNSSVEKATISSSDGAAGNLYGNAGNDDENRAIRSQLQKQMENAAQEASTFVSNASRPLNSKEKIKKNDKSCHEDEGANKEKSAYATTKIVAANGADVSEHKLEEISQLERIRVLKSKFRKIDTNDDKVISREEFFEAWRTHATCNLKAEEVFKEMDCGKTGVITLSEMETWYIQRTWNTIISDFKKMDKNNELMISKKVFLEVCMCNYLCPASQAKKLFKKLDVNGDGKLSFQEFSDGTEQYYVARILEETLNYDNVVHPRNTKNHPPALVSKAPMNITKFHMVFKEGSALLVHSSIMEAFNQIDWKQTDRRLTPKEFVVYFGQQGVSPSDSRALFIEFDVNSDGIVTYKEFKDYFTRHSSLFSSTRPTESSIASYSQKAQSHRTRSRRAVQ